MVIVHSSVSEEYNNLTAEYALGDYGPLHSKVIIFSVNSGKAVQGIRAKNYFDWVCKSEKVQPHRVYGIEPYEEYRKLFEDKEKGEEE